MLVVAHGWRRLLGLSLLAWIVESWFAARIAIDRSLFQTLAAEPADGADWLDALLVDWKLMKAAKSRTMADRIQGAVRWRCGGCAGPATLRLDRRHHPPRGERLMIEQMVATFITGAAKALTGAQCQWVGCGPYETQRIYYANHSSHLDFILLWSALPPALRRRTRPVAAADYWFQRNLQTSS